MGFSESTGNDDEYLIHELDPLPNRFISVPRDLGTLNCAAFNAGVISGILDAAGMTAKVTAHNVAIDGQPGAEKTVYLPVQFSHSTFSGGTRAAQVLTPCIPPSLRLSGRVKFLKEIQTRDAQLRKG